MQVNGNKTIIGYKPGQPEFASSIAAALDKCGISANAVLAVPPVFNMYPGILRVQSAMTKSAYMECFFYDNESHIMEMVNKYTTFITTIANVIANSIKTI